MKKASILLLTALLIASFSGSAEETPSIEDWDDVEGVTVQPDERVEKINAYRKKLREAEKEQLKQGWDQEGLTVQPDERVRHLNELEQERRKKEISEIKCTMCKMRCGIVRDAGESSCVGASQNPGVEACAENADNFLEACLAQCEGC